jgi:hypothetical protein
MHVNAQMIPVETIPGTGGVRGKRREVEGVNSSMMYLIHCKIFCKGHKVPPPSVTIKKNITCIFYCVP